MECALDDLLSEADPIDGIPPDDRDVDSSGLLASRSNEECLEGAHDDSISEVDTSEGIRHDDRDVDISGVMASSSNEDDLECALDSLVSEASPSEGIPHGDRDVDMSGVLASSSNDGSNASDIDRLANVDAQEPRHKALSGRGMHFKRRVQDVLVAARLPKKARHHLQRHIDSCTKAHTQEHEAHVALQNAWDGTRLRYGDMATQVDDVGNRKQWNAWDLNASIKLGFEQVGATNTTDAMRSTHSPHIAAEAIAHASTQSTDRQIKQLFQSIARGSRKVDHLFLERASDATPIDVAFGSMERLLCHSARYFKKDDVTKKWELYSYDAAKSINLKCKGGVLEVFAQTLKMVWWESARHATSYKGADDKILRVEMPAVKPVYLSSTSTSSIFDAVDQAFSGLALDELKRMTEYISWIALAMPADSAASTQRMKAFVQSSIAEHNASAGHKGKLLWFESHCLCHMLMNILKHVLKLSILVPRMYAISYTFRFPPRYNRLLKILQYKIEHDLVSGGPRVLVVESAPSV